MLQRSRATTRYLPMIATIALACTLAACGGDNDDEPTPTTLTLEKIGSYNGGAVGAAEITAYDAASKRLFVVNGANGTVDVLDLSAPNAPKLLGTISVAGLGKAVNSVAVYDGLVALAIEAAVKTDPGTVAFYNAADLKLINSVKVGALPDMLVFTPDGTKVLVANEGEPSGYGVAGTSDPEGAVSIITVNRGGAPSVATADFRSFNGQETALRAQGIRIFGPKATAAQDFEPEYITVSEDGKTAWVTLQENNAIAIVDVASAKVTSIKPLGFKDHNVAGFGMDASDEDGGTNTNSGTPATKIGPQPVKGMYLPDAIAGYTVDGKHYLLTANEGDARADWPGFNEETRIRAHCTAGLDPSVFPNAGSATFDSNLGRLRVTTTPNGGGMTGKNAAGQCTELYTFGGRSFSIWDTDIKRVYDSGDEFERRTSTLPNARFNASNDNNNLEDRSGSKGPEPEGVVVGKFGDKQYAFVGLERIGGVMVYDITKPASASFVTYLNTRDGDKGDLGPEGLTFIPAHKSPNGKPLLIVGNEVSGTTAVMQVNLTY
jgi:DNA-binding beta-propeller fold protein YncE